MIVNMSEIASEEQVQHVIDRVNEAGYQAHVIRGTERTIVAAVGSGRRHEMEALRVAPGWRKLWPSPSLSSWSAGNFGHNAP